MLLISESRRGVFVKRFFNGGRERRRWEKHQYGIGKRVSKDEIHKKGKCRLFLQHV
jgi:hypothetical protein